MDRLVGLVAVLLVLGTSCVPRSSPPPAETPTPIEGTFPVPYFPDPQTALLGRSVSAWEPDWEAASVYTEAGLTPAQRAKVVDLEPAGGEGTLGLGFERDFDGDGQGEAVCYGAYRKVSGEVGNFLLVTKEGEKVYLREFPGPPAFTIFTLKPDGSLWFGGGIDAGEVTSVLRWGPKGPFLESLR